MKTTIAERERNKLRKRARQRTLENEEAMTPGYGRKMVKGVLVKGEKEMKELISIASDGTNYLNILKKLANIKEQDTSNLSHVQSKIRFDARSSSPRRKRFSNNDLPSQHNLFGHSLTDDSISLLETEQSYYTQAQNSH